ncbi:hypothetical protein [Clostridium massiliamazoniense]|uniref:hypothetical protein n=1 Tax=Clostridium massiliamazoniense TaxID=1347366 RepID=UPI0006D7861F|nr:hypothetical protein [Clostridium massiliamazoniense]
MDFYLTILLITFIIFICIIFLIYNLSATAKNIPSLKYIDKKFEEILSISDNISKKVDPSSDVSKILDVITTTINILKNDNINEENFVNRKYDVIVAILEAMDIVVDNNVAKIIINKIEKDIKITRANG